MQSIALILDRSKVALFRVQPRTQGTFGNESTLVDHGHVVSFIAQILGNKIRNFEGGNIIY